jgi:hypothetical protein
LPRPAELCVASRVTARTCTGSMPKSISLIDCVCPLDSCHGNGDGVLALLDTMRSTASYGLVSAGTTAWRCCVDPQIARRMLASTLMAQLAAVPPAVTAASLPKRRCVVQFRPGKCLDVLPLLLTCASQ